MANRKDVEKLTYSKTISLPGGDGYTPQSLALKSKSERIVFCSGTNPNHILKCTESNIDIKKGSENLGHANGATYCAKNNLIYVTAYQGSNNIRKIRALNASTFNLKFTVTLPVSATGIAYDAYTDQFLVSSGNHVRIFPYSALEKGGEYNGKYRSFTKQFMGDNRDNQDIGAYNGIAMVCRSFNKDKKGRNQTAYIDCYNIADGTYLKSYMSEYGEIESVAIDGDGHMHVLFAQWRSLVKTDNVFSLVGTAPRSTTGVNIEEASIYDGERIVEKGMSFLGEGGDRFWEYGNLAVGQAWCACFVWCIASMCNLSDCCYPKGKYYVPTCVDWLKSHKKFKMIYSKEDKKDISFTELKPGDIFIYGSNSHIGFVRKAKGKNSFYTIEGNWSKKVKSVTKYKSDIAYIFRPPYSFSGGASPAGNGGSALTLQVSAEKLYSSSNYRYANDENSSNQAINTFKENLSNLIKEFNFEPIPDTEANTEVILSGGSLDTRKRRKTKINTETSGPVLPIALNPIEAPFIELTIGEYTFGTYKNDDRYDKYPNYVNSLNVIRTNGSMNEYTINLVHQIRPGSNPNFIDEILSKNGYDKITIKYGDANSYIEFIDSNALLISVDVDFDFINCNINYTLKATSSSISIASHKRNFSSTTDKPSNVIRELLYNDSSNDLITAFPAMKDRSFVESKNLIPTNDLPVEIEAFENINVVTYLKNLVAAMQNNISDVVNSTYMLIMENGYFRISEVSSSFIYDALLYEVDINFPDDNQVFNFSVDTNFSWPIAYNYGGKVSNYNYNISNDGNITKYRTNSSNLLDFSSEMMSSINKNWWTQVTEFPDKAKLTCRGLLSPLLLLTYIKVNCIYFGSDRITSGIYIVTGQEDSLGKEGYRTTLSLLRVAGPKQQLTIDGRIRT